MINIGVYSVEMYITLDSKRYFALDRQKFLNNE